MKVSIYDSAKDVNNTFTSPGLTITGPLLLNGSVAAPLEAIHKQYVDTIVTSINASNVNNGTLPPGRLPAFTGDISTTQGSNVLILGNNGVVAGEYTKVTVDTKGRVSSGTTLSVNDIPNLDWSKITTGKPTTAAGYGITDTISNNGSTINGVLTLSSDPINSNEIVTKGYVDGVLSLGGNIITGNIISKFTSTTPSGFLRCNGGQVSKTTYSSLYSVIGDNFSYSNIPGNGRPWAQQYDFNTDQPDIISNWTTSGVGLESLEAFGVAGLGVIKINKRIYMLGGYDPVVSDTVYYIPINDDGSLGTKVLDTNKLPGATSHSTVVLTNNRVYLLGGTTSDGRTATANVYYSNIQPDGTLGNWNISSLSLATASYDHCLVKTSSRVYLVSGSTWSGGINTIQYATLNTDGSIGSWVNDTNTSPLSFYLPGSVVILGTKCYIIGGYSGGGVNKILVANIDSNGILGAFTYDTDPVGLPGQNYAGAACLVTSNKVYLIGGWYSTATTGVTINTIYYTNITYTGTLNANWTSLSISLPLKIRFASGIKINNKFYLIGGSVTYDTNNNSYSSSGIFSFNLDTSDNIIESNRLPTKLQDSVGCVTKNRVYLFGGYDTSGNGSITNTILTAPINSDGTIGNWTGSYTHPNGSEYGISVFTTKNYIHMVGGYNGGPVALTYYTSIDGTGNIYTTSWSQGSNLPSGLFYTSVLVTSNRVYLIGGMTSNTGATSAVYTASINTNGTLGTWSTGTALPAAVGMASIAVIKNKVYLLGGYNGSSVLSSVYSATINADGTLGSWSTVTALPVAMYKSTVIVTRKRVYILGYHGGTSGTYASSNIYSAPINIDGSLGTWTVTGKLPNMVANSVPVITGSKLHLLGGSYVSGYYYLNTAVDTILSADFVGGSNDYSPYYFGTITPTDPTKFNLPDYSKYERVNFYYFIKY